MAKVLPDLYYKILRIRMIEDAIAKRYSEQQMRCPVHLSIGQEAAAVGVAQALNHDDYMVSTHRGHAHYLAKGGDARALISELYGKQTGCSKGQGGSMHLVDWSAGFVASTSIVGGTIPVGVGTAFCSYLRGEKKVSVVCIGDAAVEEGVFHESANFASLHKLPVIFACENNSYSCYTSLANRQPKRPLIDIAQSHGMKGLVLDGNDVFAIYSEVGAVVEQVRAGAGPVFVEMKTFRHLEHCGPNNDDTLQYRTKEEIAHWLGQDPIEIAKARMIRDGSWSDKWGAEITSKIQSEVDEVFRFALEAPFPNLDQLGAYVYAK